MATDLPQRRTAMYSRRDCLQSLGAGALGLLAPWVHARATSPVPEMTTLLAAWQADSSHTVGLIRPTGSGWSVLQQLALPSRPHGLHALPDGSVLVAARRPGDWLLHWQPDTGLVQWHWEQGDQRFNGHVLNTPQQPDRFFTSETDLDSGTGRIGVWHLPGLQRLATWSSQGLDPHQLLVLPETIGTLPAGTLLVANGGIPTQAESGRSKKQLARMDPSLVALDPGNGTLLGQWRLPDPRLSIRHLAWNPVSRQLGVALQAEHDDAQERLNAPVLACWDGRALRPQSTALDLQGYGGSVCATPDGGFCVSCPRAGGVAWFDAQTRFRQLQPLAQACPLAWQGGPDGQLWAGGGARIEQSNQPPTASVLTPPASAQSWLFDNHWLLLPGTQAAG